MASGGARPKQSQSPAGSDRLLTGSDDVSPALLTLVSRHVMARTQMHFGTAALGFHKAHVENKEVAFPNNPERVHLVLLQDWIGKDLSIKVDVLMEKLVAWIRDGYVSSDVWSHVEKLVSPEVIPAHPVTPAPSGGAWTTQRSGQTTVELLTSHDFEEMQKKAKIHLERTYNSSLSTDWFSQKDAKAMPIQYYTGLKWKRKVKGGLKDSSESVQNILDVISVKEAGKKPMNILVEGAPGMGKTATMAYLVMEWVKQKRSGESKKKFFTFWKSTPKENVPFHLVFLIPLRNVDDDIPLAELIKTTHGLEDYPTEHVDAILKGKANYKVLLLLDGYDEYTRGTNRDIDSAIEKTIGNCCTLVTSRPGKDGHDETYVRKEVRSKMDGEVTIEGFSDDSIEKCSELFLGSREQSDAMLHQVKQKSTKWRGKYTGLWELLRTPITLLMICVLFNEKQSLQDTKTKIYQEIRTLSMNRTTIKKLDKESKEIRNLDNLLYWLGEFAWKALQNDHQQLLLNKKDIETKDPDILKLGLLHEAGGSESATIGKKQIFVSFQHKTIQEFSAADFITKSVEKSPNPEAALKEFFPSIEVVKKQREVVQFCAGLMSDKMQLFNHLSSLHLEELKSDESSRVSEYLLDEMYRESQVELPGTEPLNPLYRYVMKRLLQQLSHCTKLTMLRLRENTLTGLLSEFTPDTPLHSLEGLELMGTGLNKHDIQHLGSLTNKLPALKKLNLSNNYLTGLLPEFTPDTPLHSLERLWLGSTRLDRRDVLHVAHLIRTNKLPALKELDLSSNTLTGLLSELFTPDTPLHSLEVLDLGKTGLNRHDVLHVARLMRTNKLPALWGLNLSGNTLTGLLSEFTPNTPLHSLKLLNLLDTRLNKQDVLHVAHLIRTNKLPALKWLWLLENSLCDMEDEAGKLIEACVTHHQRELDEEGVTHHQEMYLWLEYNNLSDEFKEKWERRCEGTNIELDM